MFLKLYYDNAYIYSKVTNITLQAWNWTSFWKEELE